MPLPLGGVVGTQLCVEAVQTVLTGGQQVCFGGSGGKADVQRRGADLQYQQLTGGTKSRNHHHHGQNIYPTLLDPLHHLYKHICTTDICLDFLIQAENLKLL